MAAQMNNDIDALLAGLNLVPPNPEDAGKSFDDKLDELVALGTKVTQQNKGGPPPPPPGKSAPPPPPPGTSGSGGGPKKWADPIPPPGPAPLPPRGSKVPPPPPPVPGGKTGPPPPPGPAKATAPPPAATGPGGAKLGPIVQVFPPGPNKHDRAALEKDIGLANLSIMVYFELGEDLSYFPKAGTADYKAAVENLKTFFKHINTAFQDIEKRHGAGTIKENYRTAYVVHSTTNVFCWGDAKNDAIYFLRNFEKLPTDKYNTTYWQDMIFTKIFSNVGEPTMWLPLKSVKGDEGIMMSEIRKLTGNPDLKFFFDWSASKVWKVSSDFSAEKAKQGLTLDATWLPGLVQCCAEHKQIREGLKNKKNIIFKLDMNDIVKLRTSNLFWRSCAFDVCPDTISFEIDYCWLFGDRRGELTNYSIKKISELPKTKEWKWMFMPEVAVQEENAAFDAREKWYKSLSPDQQQYYKRYT